MRSCTAIVILLLLAAAGMGAQTPQDQGGALASAQVVDGDGQPLRLVPITGLSQPWAIAFLPNGDILVTERPGRLRIVRNGVLDPQPIAGLPEVNTRAITAGLMDVAVHPRYAENKLIYFTYSKSMPGNPHDDFRWEGDQRVQGEKRDAATCTLARARFDGGSALTDVRDLFVADAWAQGSSASRIVFAPDGKLLMTVGMPTRHAIGNADDAQNPGNHAGKVLRLNDDGTVPADNPFVGQAGYRPEIYAMGIRNALGLFVHPDTGEIWETENGPHGGDEINIIRAGRNYGWPIVSYGRDYSGKQIGGLSGTSSEARRKPGMEEPFLYWSPSPAVSGIAIYTGDRFPSWKGNIFVGALGSGSLGSRQLHRILLNKEGLPMSRGNRSLLAELKQRVREVKQGPDGLLYVTTDEMDGALIRLEPLPASASAEK